MVLLKHVRTKLQGRKIPDLSADGLLRYEEKLLPLIEHVLHELELDPNPVQTQVRTLLPITQALNVQLELVAHLLVKPGEPWFIYWFIVALYFPLILACAGPLANTISFIGLLEHWRVDNATGKFVDDRPRMKVVNLLSFVFGILGNVLLLMNFSGTAHYLISQSTTVFCWVTAAALLVVDLLLTNRDCLGPNPRYSRSEGFWFGALAAFFYVLCCLILLVNFAGYRLKKYPPRFNLDEKQRMLMVYTVVFSVWLVVGTVSIVHLVEEVSFGALLYYCTVLMLTVGLGDITPRTLGAKVFALVFSLIGVLIMGLIVAMVRLVILLLANPIIFWHKIERARVKLLLQGPPADLEQAFHDMRVIRRKAKIKQANILFLLTVLVFMLYWLVGAVIFYAVETWLYFNSLYFCFLCLLTIGYGDFAPKTAFGRVFFVSWALVAVPLMTTLILNVGDQLFMAVDSISFLIMKVFNLRLYQSLLQRRAQRRKEGEDLSEDTVQRDEEAEERVMEQVSSSLLESKMLAHEERVRALLANRILTRSQQFSTLLDCVAQLKPYVRDSLESPLKRYDYGEWWSVLTSVGEQRLDATEGNRAPYWLSDLLPLRLPLKEPNYLVLRLFHKLENELRTLVDEEERLLLRLEQLPHKRLTEMLEEHAREHAKEGVDGASALSLHDRVPWQEVLPPAERGSI